MKKIVKFAASLLVFAGALASCKKEAMTQELVSNAPTSFTAQLESTKLTIDGFTPKFEVGDEITVETTVSMMVTAKATFQVSKVNADGSAAFNIKGSWSGTPVPPYCIYTGSVATDMLPYGSRMINFNLPYMEMNAASQKINKTVLFGKTDDLENGVTLRNACALLKVTVSEPIKKLKIAASSGYVSPLLSVNFENNMCYGTNAINEFVYTNGAGMIEVGTYYIPFAPTQPAAPISGLKAGVSNDGEEFIWKEKSGNINIERNKIYDLGNVNDWKPAPSITVADFVGTFKGSYSAYYNINHNAKTELTDQEFVLEEISEGDYNVLLKTVGGLQSGAKGTLDINTGILIFPKDQPIPYPGNYMINAAQKLGDDLKLQFSEDINSIKMVNDGCLINAISYPSYCPELYKIELTRTSGGGGEEGFKITDLTGHTYSVSCEIEGTQYTGELTATNTLAPGSNVYLSGIFGTGSEAFATFDVETGNLTLSTNHAVKLPISILEYSTIGDNILVMSADKKTITIHEDLNDMLLLCDPNSNYVTISKFTATLKN